MIPSPWHGVFPMSSQEVVFMKMLLRSLAFGAAAAWTAAALASPAAQLSLLAIQQGGPQPWSSPAAWGGRLPATGDTVTIPKGRHIVLDVSTPRLRGLRIEGTLTASQSRDVGITADHVVVLGGRLTIGTAASPYLRRAVITLTGSSAADIPGVPGIGNKVLGVIGGCLELHGAPSARNWTKLGADAVKGSRTITLAEAPGWKTGDEIVIATSSTKMNEFDRATVSAVSGKTVTLAQPLKFRHLGAVRTFGIHRVDVRAEAGLLTKNIVVQGDETSATTRIGGHAMFMNGRCPTSGMAGCACGDPSRNATIQIADTEWRSMGQFNRVGRYPIHFHQMGAMTASYIKNSVVKDSIQRGIVLHDVSGVECSGNVVFNTVGHNFVVETEITRDNRILGNLALVNRQPSPLFSDPELKRQNDREPANFWMKSGRNIVTGNSAAGSLRSGFIYDNINTDPIHFVNNTAHAAMVTDDLPGHGDFDLAAGVIIVVGEPRPAADKISDFTVYHNVIGFWPEETSFVVDRMIAADNDLHTENRGVGNKVVYRDCVFVGRLSEPRERSGSALHFQYGSDVTLVNPTFVNMGGAGITSVTDSAILPHSNVWISNAKFIGARPWNPIGDDIVATYLDDSILPRGTYTAFPEYSAPGAARVNFQVDDDLFVVFRSAQRPEYSELTVRRMSAPGVSLHESVPIVRSDGLRFMSGMRGYPVITSMKLSYQVTAASPSGFALRLSEDEVSGPSALVEASVPMPAAPKGVFRGGGNFDNPGPRGTGARLKAAATRAELEANPLGTFWYDPAAKRVVVKASSAWLQVLP